jgi:hypothetical protein
MVVLPLLLLALYAWGGSHHQDWDCLGPNPGTFGACGVKQPVVVPDRDDGPARARRFGVDFSAYRTPRP